MNIQPIGDRVLIKPAPEKEKTDSGIYIPDSAKEKPQMGTVISTGTLLDGTTSLSVNAGDQVLYGKYAGTEIELEGEKFLIMRENDIYAIFRHEE